MDYVSVGHPPYDFNVRDRGITVRRVTEVTGVWFRKDGGVTFRKSDGSIVKFSKFRQPKVWPIL